MDEYIKREALLEDIDAAETNGGMGAVIAQTLKRYVKRQPAADVAPVQHGQWIVYEEGVQWGFPYLCTQCNKAHNYREQFCPNCGAKMQ